MSFPIIKRLDGEENVIAILLKAKVPASPDSIRMWNTRGISPQAELALLKEVLRRKLKYRPSDFLPQPKKEPK